MPDPQCCGHRTGEILMQLLLNILCFLCALRGFCPNFAGKYTVMVIKKLILYSCAAVVFAASVSCGKAGASNDGSAAMPDTVAVSLPSDSSAQADVIRDDSLTLSFVGDIMMGTTWPDSIHGSHLPVDGGRHLFDDCRDIFRRVDIACGNLEGSFLNGPGKRRPMRNPKTYFIFRMPPEYAANLVDAGFDFVGIANNHINDFGEPGRKSTMDALREAGIPHAGLKGRCETVYLERGGRRVGLTQFGHGANNLDVTDLDELGRVVGQMRDSADIVVVTFHGGAEGTAHMHVPHKTETYVGENRGNVEAFAHAAIDAGADVVVGHGPHVPRAAELYKGRIIFYSLGNFCTPYRMGIAGATGYAPVAEITIGADGKFRSGQIHSFIQKRGLGPRKDPTNAAARLIKRLSIEDFPASSLHISDSGRLSTPIR